jgi:hypothetical protein
MCRQLIAMRMGMGIVPGRERRLSLRGVRRMGIRVAHGVMFFLPFLAFLILTALQPKMRLRVTGMGFWSVSR